METQTGMLTIRRASIEDLDMLLDWRMRVLGEVFADRTLDETQRLSLRESNRQYYLKSIPTGKHIAIFAFYGDHPVGCGGACLQHELPSPDNPSGSCAYLMNIYVLPEFRRHEVGRLIVESLVESSRAVGIGKIYLETSQSGRPLYELLGFKNMPDMMKL